MPELSSRDRDGRPERKSSSEKARATMLCCSSFESSGSNQLPRSNAAQLAHAFASASRCRFPARCSSSCFL
eukprot:2610771-Prymnesium_polylepis.2